MVLEIVIGIVIASLSVWLVSKIYPNKEHAYWRIGLIVAALIYVGFAVYGKNWEYLPIEFGGFVLYGAFAWMSKKFNLMWLSIGWGLHILWDVFLHAGAETSFVPSWYPGICLGFDIVIAIYIFWVYKRRT